ncbi:MAG: hypothetical protein JW950_05730 [Deltaproteobacteria bacterium]|nr:hypothetical protein [Deltaproteobacteria bacterium]
MGEIENNHDLKESKVSQIVSLFADVPPQKDIMIFIDDVFAEAKVRLEEMAKTAKAAYYEDIFDEQLERLRSLGCPAFIINKLKTHKVDVISRVCSLDIVENRNPLIPVIPNQYLTIYSQLAMINLNGMTGDTDLESSRILNVLKKGLSQNDSKIFDGIYFILDIDDGANTEKLTSVEANEKIKGKNRSPLTVEEIIALLLQRNEPLDSNLLAGGSRYEQDDIAPICTVEKDKIWLKTCFTNTIHPNSVTPSCGMRI